MIRRTPTSTLFPYTTLFRSHSRARKRQRDGALARGGRQEPRREPDDRGPAAQRDRKSTRLNSSHITSSYAVFCLKKKRRRIAFGLEGRNRNHPRFWINSCPG